MNWYLLATVFFIVSLHQVFAKMPTDGTGAVYFQHQTVSNFDSTQKITNLMFFSRILV